MARRLRAEAWALLVCADHVRGKPALGIPSGRLPCHPHSETQACLSRLGSHATGEYSLPCGQEQCVAAGVEKLVRT